VNKHHPVDDGEMGLLNEETSGSVLNAFEVFLHLNKKNDNQ